jgi:hypothetical protein
MFARVTRWEGHSAEELAQMEEQFSGQTEPPPGVPASGFTYLADADRGTALMIVVFDSEEDLKAGDEALSAMSPPDEAQGRLVSKELYRIGAEVRR